MNLTIILSVAGGLLAGAVLALKVIAPLTKTEVDDGVLKRLETLEEMLKKLQG